MAIVLGVGQLLGHSIRCEPVIGAIVLGAGHLLGL